MLMRAGLSRLRRRLEASPLTVAVALASLAVFLPALVPREDAFLPALLELRGEGVARAQPWRLVTGHLVHLSGRQLVLNLLAFLWLGVLCEPKIPRRYGLLLLSSSLAVGAGVLALHPTLVSYRGLSGIASAQFAALVALRAREARRQGGVSAAALPVLALLLFLAQTAYELVSGRGLFTGDLGAAAASPAAHLFGALAGLAVAFLPSRRGVAQRPGVVGAPGPAPRRPSTSGVG